LFALLLSGCSTPSLTERRALADELAAAHGWQHATLVTGPFVLAAWLAPTRGSDQLTIFIEGDGNAWATRRRPSSNPTPRSPAGLKLALAHPGGNVAYLARPCQYVTVAEQRGCGIAIWTRERFSKAVVDATDQAVSMLKSRRPARRLTLVGYSGGGTVAALVAARRADVDQLVTVASPLDHQQWTNAKHLSPLTGSLNPADHWSGLVDVPQIHFVGLADKVVDASSAESYRSRFPESEHIRIERMEGFDHRCCWVNAWPTLVTSWEKPAR
jgi:hypothetical protein